MALKYQLSMSPAAKDDLRDIYQYGFQRWGETKSKSYLNDLKMFIWSLLELPMKDHDRSDLQINMLSKRLDSHVVFYRVVQRKIDIVRILHARQDASAQF